MKDKMVPCNEASKQERLEQWMANLKLKFLNNSDAMEVVGQANRY